MGEQKMGKLLVYLKDYKKESGNSVKSGGFAVEEGKAYLS